MLYVDLVENTTSRFMYFHVRFHAYFRLGYIKFEFSSAPQGESHLQVLEIRKKEKTIPFFKKKRGGGGISAQHAKHRIIPFLLFLPV